MSIDELRQLAESLSVDPQSIQHKEFKVQWVASILEAQQRIESTIKNDRIKSQGKDLPKMTEKLYSDKQCNA